MILVPGVEVKPYYYWTGTPWNKLTLHNFNRHLTVSGLSEEDLSDLPVIGNATWNNTTKQRLPALVPALILLVGVSLVFSERRRPVRLREHGVVKRRLLRKFAMFSVGLSLFATWNNYPFGRLADPYSGEHDLRPYQRLIDYVVSKDGLVYWSHPEARYHDVEAGGAKMVSRPYPGDLLATDNYHGLAGIYGDQIRVTLPGETWDRTLMQYLNGLRRRPPYVVTDIDFHYFKRGGARWYELDGGQTILLMPEKSKLEVLRALRTGRSYATFQGEKERVALCEFRLQTADGGAAAQGSEISGISPLQIRIQLDWVGKAQEDLPFALQLIRNGQIIESLEQPLPILLAVKQNLAPGRYYFRLRAVSKRKYEVLSNPLFVEVVEPDSRIN